MKFSLIALVLIAYVALCHAEADAKEKKAAAVEPPKIEKADALEVELFEAQLREMRLQIQPMIDAFGRKTNELAEKKKSIIKAAGLDEKEYDVDIAARGFVKKAPAGETKK